MAGKYFLEKSAQAWCDKKTSSKTMDTELAEVFADILETEVLKMKDAAEMLWTVVANASGGDWLKQSQEWQEAAERWRDNYWKIVSTIKFE